MIMKLPPQKLRNALLVPMMAHSHSTRLRDRRTRRAKDARRSWRNEEH